MLERKMAYLSILRTERWLLAFLVFPVLFFVYNKRNVSHHAAKADEKKSCTKGSRNCRDGCTLHDDSGHPEDEFRCDTIARNRHSAIVAPAFSNQESENRQQVNPVQLVPTGVAMRTVFYPRLSIRAYDFSQAPTKSLDLVGVIDASFAQRDTARRCRQLSQA